MARHVFETIYVSDRPKQKERPNMTPSTPYSNLQLTLMSSIKAVVNIRRETQRGRLKLKATTRSSSKSTTSASSRSTYSTWPKPTHNNYHHDLKSPKQQSRIMETKQFWVVCENRYKETKVYHRLEPTRCMCTTCPRGLGTRLTAGLAPG